MAKTIKELEDNGDLKKIVKLLNKVLEDFLDAHGATYREAFISGLHFEIEEEGHGGVGSVTTVNCTSSASGTTTCQ